MSHSLRKVNLGNSALVQITIIDYVQGGESFTLNELGITGSVLAAYMLEVTPLGEVNSPVSALNLVNGKLVLYADTSGMVELQSTTGLNYTFFGIVQGS